MSSNLDIFTGGGTVAARSHGKSLQRIERNTSLSVARIDGEAQRQAAKVDAVAQVGATAMRNVAQLSQLEVQLGQLVPAAVSRLQAIGDMTALEIAGLVGDAARAIYRAG